MKNKFLNFLIKNLILKKEAIIEANKRDMRLTQSLGLSHALIQRLEFNEAGIKQAIERIKNLQKLDSGIGEVIENKKMTNGLILNKVRTAIGKIAVIYESRPEVTIDAVCLCIKSGNKVILKGGSEALQTNLALMECVKNSLGDSGISKDWVEFIEGRTEFLDILKRGEGIDLVIARGSYELVRAVNAISKVPVLAHSAGGARIYIDKSADLKKAEKIIINAKASKPSACNSIDTILIHQGIKESFIKGLVKSLEALGVEVLQSDSQDWSKEFLDLTVNIKIVKDVYGAAEFINKYGKGHSEGIIAQDKKVVEEFLNNVDCAGIFINCSTRFHDGFEFGMGSEMGIATGKLHARGPVGIKELTTYRWEVYGQGQIR